MFLSQELRNPWTTWKQHLKVDGEKLLEVISSATTTIASCGDAYSLKWDFSKKHKWADYPLPHTVPYYSAIITAPHAQLHSGGDKSFS